VVDLGQLVLHLGQHGIVGSNLGGRRLERSKGVSVPPESGLRFTGGDQGGDLWVAEGESPPKMADRLGMGVEARGTLGGKPPPPGGARLTPGAF
jgi:hypothetical protein